MSDGSARVKFLLAWAALLAAKLVLEPIYEADFAPSSYGFRPRRSAKQALERLRQLGNQGANHVLDADIENYFGSIEHDKLLKVLEVRSDAYSVRPSGDR